MFICCPMLLHASVVVRVLVSAFIGYQPYMRLFLRVYGAPADRTYYVTALFKWWVTRMYVPEAVQHQADLGGMELNGTPFVYIVYSRWDGLISLG